MALIYADFGTLEFSRIAELSGAARREEIARMLAGDRTGDVSLQHAGELLARYGREEARAGGAPEERG